MGSKGSARIIERSTALSSSSSISPTTALVGHKKWNHGYFVHNLKIVWVIKDNLHVVASDNENAKFDLFNTRHAVNSFVAVVQNEIDGLIISFQDALHLKKSSHVTSNGP